MPDYELDRADCRILEIVQRDGRISNVDLAGHVALSPSPCLRRLSRLEESAKSPRRRISVARTRRESER